MRNAFEILGKSFQIEINQDGIIGAAFSDTPSETTNLELYDQALREMLEYAEGKRKVFTLPLHPKGTPFQIKVWNALLEIPYGETRTYGQIAQAIGKPKASRAVGGACNRNPIGIIIPCHRVIGSDGKLTGYYGGLEYKELLLNHEKRWTE